MRDRTEALMANERIRIVPSVLPADFARLGEDVQALEKAGVDRIQWDVMDGQYVPNITMGPNVIAACRPLVGLGFEAHLMVKNPDPMIGRWVEAGCELVIVHAETCLHLHRTLGSIRELGARTGVALNPATPLSAVENVLDLLDLLLVMTVNPGFGGQSYIATMEPKIAAARAMLDEKAPDVELEVDGGISIATIGAAAAAGARTFCVGSALFADRDNLGDAVQRLRAGATEGLTTA